MGSAQILLKGNVGGLDTKSDELNISPQASPSLDGVVLSQNGSISSFPGRSIIIPSNAADGKLAGRPVKYKTIYMDDSGAQAVEVPILYADNGTTAEWFKADYVAGTVTSLGTVTAGGIVNAVQFKNDLIITSTAHVPKVSASLGAIANLAGYPPNYVATYSATYDLSEFSQNPSDFSVPTQPGLCESHVQCAWIAARALAMKSVLFKDNTWASTDLNFLRHWWWSNTSDNMGDLVQIKRWNDVLAGFKQKGIYLIEGTHPRSVPGTRPFNPIKTPASVGLVGPYALDYVLNDIVFGDSNGYVQLLSSAILKETANQKPISEFIQTVLDDIPIAERKNMIIRAWPAKHQVWVAYNDGSASATAGQNNALAIWDYRLNNWTKASNIVKAASILVHNNKLYTGTYDGAIHRQYSGTTHGLTERVSSYYFPWINPGSDFNIASVDLTFAGATAGRLLFQTIFNNGTEQYSPIDFVANTAGVYDTSLWDNAYYSAGSGRTLIKKTIYPSGYGAKCQPRLYSNQENFAWTFLEGVMNINTQGNSAV